MKIQSIPRVVCVLLLVASSAASLKTRALAADDAPHPPALDVGDADRIVFVCDSGGDMVNKVASARTLLKSALHSLNNKQNFNVIFTNSGNTDSVAGNRLIPATEANVKKAGVLVDAMPTANPQGLEGGLKLALKQRPGVIVLISGREPTDPKAILKLVQSLDKNKATKINIAALDGGGAEYVGEGLKEVAEYTGGNYKVINIDAR